MKQWRIYLLLAVVFLCGSGMLARLFSIQVLQYDYYYALAQDQHQFYKALFPERGEVFLSDISLEKREGQGYYQPLAVNKEFYQVYLVPKDITGNKEEVADKLSSLLDLDKTLVLERINKENDPYEPLKHKVEEKIAKEIEELNIKGIKTALETWRYYPNGTLASHLIGFVGISEQEKKGQYGLEEYYEEELKGKNGFLAGQKDTAGYSISFTKDEIKKARNGSDIILTVDHNIQFQAEKELKRVVDKWRAESGTIIIMQPKTGAILAMANWPNFNPNEYNKVEDINVFLNSSISQAFELGSVFKPITMAAGIDSGTVGPNTGYEDRGQVQMGVSVISNVDGNSYGWQTMTQVLEKSLNTGAVFVQQQLGKKLFREYIYDFNFHEPTGIDLSGEIGGDIFNVFTNSKVNLATISFGQGITITPIGLLSAISAIANGGKLMKPFVVKKTIHNDRTEKITEPKEVKRVISKESAETLTKMLVSVVDNGYGKPARIAGYNIAGKTGTAQVPDLEKGGYSEDEYIHSFVGFAPAYNPEFAILIKIDKPKGIRFASDSVSPVFKNLTEYLFGYLEIPPQ